MVSMSDLPLSARKAIRNRADELAAAVREEVVRDARGTPDPVTLRNLGIGARAAVARFVARASGDAEPADLSVFVAHGRAQQAAGRTLAELLAFYRLGGLAVWRTATAFPELLRLQREELIALGAELLAYVDELSGAAVEGFTAQEAESRRLERARRERLVSLLLVDPPAGPEALAAAAQAAGWELPARVRVAVTEQRLDGGGERGAPPARVLVASEALARDALGARGEPAGGGPVALVVADDDATDAWLERAARALGLAAPLAVGPAAPPQRAAASARRAAALSRLVGAGAIVAAGPVVRSDEHELALLLGADPELAAGLADRRLAPLDGLAPGQRRRLAETLAGWLARPDRPQAIADELGVHVQTVRYRVRQLRELFGEALDDPDARFELALALRARATG